MTRQGAVSPRLAPRDAYWSRFLGPFRNSFSSSVPNIPISGHSACYNPNTRVRVDTFHHRPPHNTEKTAPPASRSLGFRFRGFSVGLSGRDPVLERCYGNAIAISVSADCRWLRSGERGVALVVSMDYFATIGDGRDLVLSRRSARLELSHTGNHKRSIVRVVGGCLGSILHSRLASSCPGSWALAGYDLGICDWRIGDSAFWRGVVSELSNAIDTVWAWRIGRAHYFRHRLRDDSGLRSLLGRFETALGHRDWFSLLLGTHRGSCGSIRIPRCNLDWYTVSRWGADHSSSGPPGFSKSRGFHQFLIHRQRQRSVIGSGGENKRRENRP